MPHCLITGITESGKTTLAVQLAQGYRDLGINVIVLDPLRDARWPANFQTAYQESFLNILLNPDTRSCAVFVDESGEEIGRYNKEMFWLATRGRHYGHNAHFITQRVVDLNKTVRAQCRYLYIFNSNVDDCMALSKDFNRPEILQATELKKGEYFKVARFATETFIGFEKKAVF